VSWNRDALVAFLYKPRLFVMAAGQLGLLLLVVAAAAGVEEDEVDAGDEAFGAAAVTAVAGAASIMVAGALAESADGMIALALVVSTAEVETTVFFLLRVKTVTRTINCLG